MTESNTMTIYGIRTAMATTDQMQDNETKDLIDAWILIDEEHARDGEILNRLAFVLQTRMEARGATAEPHATHDVTFESTKNDYDQLGLTPILELIDQDLAVEKGAYTPAHQKLVDVPASWNVTKARALKKYDAGVLPIVEAAKRPNRPVLRITPKAKT